MSMDWIPALSTTSLLAVVLWLSRNLIAARLQNSVKHDYDKKIESLKTTLRKSEESFKAELTAKESQIDALRSGALAGMVNRQAALYERRVAAVGQLWKAVISLDEAKAISACMATIKFEAVAKVAANDPKVRETFAMLGEGFNIKSINTKEASVARPFISPLAWALFSAYQAVIIHAVFRMRALEKGIDEDYIDVEAITKLVKVALPHQESNIEKYGPAVLHYLLDELERKILSELRRILNGEDSDEESMEKAARILKEAERLVESNNPMGD